MREDLTEKQQELLRYIRNYTVHHPYPPTLRQMADHLGLRTLSTVHQHLKALEAKGALSRNSSRERNVRIHDTPKLIRIPLLGEIAAGLPIEPVENAEPVFVSTQLVKSADNHYALRVRGDSMIDDGIQDNDIVIIRAQNYVDRIGETIVAVTDHGATLKRFGGVSQDGIVKLIPRNPRMEPMFADANTFEVRGKFVGLLRKDRS